VKPGYRTSEFWLLFCVLVACNVQAAGVFGESHWTTKLAAVVANILGALGYNYERARIKLAETNAAKPGTTAGEAPPPGPAA